MRAPDSEPEITEMMIAGGISQLPRQDWDLATATDALTRIYRVMRPELSPAMWTTLACWRTSCCAKRR